MKTSEKGFPKARFIITFLVVLCLGVSIGLVFTPMFHVREIVCEGTQRIPKEEVIKAAEDAIGKNIFFLSLSGIEKKVEEIPLAEKATVRRKLPDKLEITVEETVPAAYIRTGSDCVLCDRNGKILEVLPEAEAQAIFTAYTPIEEEKIPEQSPEKTEQKTEAKTAQTDDENEDIDEDYEEYNEDEDENEDIDEDEDESEDKKEEKPKATPEQDQTQASGENGNQDVRKYPAPLVDGITLKNPKAGKQIETEDKAKTEQYLQLFRALEGVGLLDRTTYMDLKNPTGIRFVIEKRLTVEFGDLQNMEYRCSFLAKVINERISAGEEAVLDFRNGDLYVRPPEDGQERVKPKPSASPKSSVADDDEDDDEDSRVSRNEDEDEDE